MVAARLAEDRARIDVKGDPSLKDVCDHVERLLDLASLRCWPDGQCDLTARQINAIVAVAFLHREHPDFDTEWARRRRVDQRYSNQTAPQVVQPISG